MTKQQAIANATKKAYASGGLVRFGTKGEIVVQLFGRLTAMYIPSPTDATRYIVPLLKVEISDITLKAVPEYDLVEESFNV